MTQATQTIPAGYKQTEIGVIPVDWDVKSLGDIGDTIIGLTYSPSDVSSYGKLVHRSSNIQNNRLSYNDNVYVSKEINEKLILQNGDILICVRNGSRDLIGKSALIKGMSIGETFGAFMSIFRTKENHQFVFYLILSNLVQKQINQSLGATINQITNKTLNNFQIPFPKNPKEQTAIATILSDTDASIENLEKLIAKKCAIKQGAMQQLLSGKKRLPGFSGEWEVKKLGEITDVVGGGTPSTSIIGYWNGDVNWFTPTEIGTSKYVNVSKRKITLEGLRNSSAKILDEGTILMTSRAGIGDLAILKLKACTNQGFQSLVPMKSTNNEFLYYLMLTKKDILLEKASGSTFLEISPNNVRAILLLIPPTIKEQTAIATVLSDMDAEIEKLENKLTKYRQIKIGMMQQLLTGKIRIYEPSN